MKEYHESISRMSKLGYVIGKRDNLPSRHGSSGVALITALLIIALVTVLAVAMASQQMLNLRRTSNLLDFDRSYLFALGAESWVRTILSEDRLNNGNVDHLDELWAKAAVIPVEEGVISGQVDDMQGRFNLNNLLTIGPNNTVVRSQSDYERFQRLLGAVGISQDVADAVQDWMDPDSDPVFPNGAEDDLYTTLEHPYRTGNTSFASPSELMLVAGFDPESYAAIAPHVTALPGRTDINVNTATAEVLMSLAQDLTMQDAGDLIAGRGNNGYQDKASFFQEPAFTGLTFVQTGVSVRSDYFLLTAWAEFGRGRVQLYSLLSRADNNTIKVLTRGLGAY